ncbi:uncharacterized protein BDW43DRAFT_282791 [Aspergillus alliaceus]|uniref:uncharacterized protein n=1 Tax=Petromyces alliaceus TaxID=209559 RepID=UPI0012A6E2A1|nr:uncharacterized protein BDW43DRAFT_282791 [Aspergillus alliaceus]KAB8231336.1 hypothetical protein BDW43DRAFT_282791 [Aspergillus alliaceus]
MPRPKVDERFRKRIAKACTYCQKSKQKCDGLKPCALCVRRDQSASCAYSPHVRSYGRNRSRQNASQRHLPPQGPRRTISDAHHQTDEPAEPEVLVPGLSPILSNNRGEAVYLGNCAALAFLQNIQQLIEAEAGPTSDLPRLSIFEEGPPTQESSCIPLPSCTENELSDLVATFFVATCGVMDLFEQDQIMSFLSNWVNDRARIDNRSRAVLCLVIACAAQMRSTTAAERNMAQSFYQHGRQIGLLELTNDPTIETIQVFALISLYMLGCCWRNGASLNLGIAISAAKSLGYHQEHAGSVLNERERQRRAQVWNTLHYHDLFFSAMMGRSCSTSSTAANADEEDRLISRGNEDILSQTLSMTESLRAFLTIESTINKVYSKQTISLGVLQGLATELRERSLALPKSFCTPASSSRNASLQDRQWNLRNAHVTCSYYFAMMLLTRPFLITYLRAKFSLRPSEATTWIPKGVSSEISDGAAACVDSATYTIQLLHELLEANVLYKNMPLIVAWAFVSALVLNAAHLGWLDPKKPFLKVLDQVDELFHHFFECSAQARRYHLILKKLSKAAEDHRKQAEERASQLRTAYIPQLFSLGSHATNKGPRSAQQHYGGASSRHPVEIDHSAQRGHHEINSSQSFMDLRGDDNSSALASNTQLPNEALDLISDLYPAFCDPCDLWPQLDDCSSIWDLSWTGSL